MLRERLTVIGGDLDKRTDFYLSVILVSLMAVALGVGLVFPDYANIAGLSTGAMVFVFMGVLPVMMRLETSPSLVITPELVRLITVYSFEQVLLQLIVFYY